MQREPTYEFVKGEGWVPRLETAIGRSQILEHEGKQYLVTVLKRQPKLTERGSHRPEPDKQDWWDEWENEKGQRVSAGFGWGLYSEITVEYTVITESIDA